MGYSAKVPADKVEGTGFAIPGLLVQSFTRIAEHVHTVALGVGDGMLLTHQLVYNIEGVVDCQTITSGEN